MIRLLGFAIITTKIIIMYVLFVITEIHHIHKSSPPPPSPYLQSPSHPPSPQEYLLSKHAETIAINLASKEPRKYTPEERRIRIMHFLEKRKTRNWNKKVRQRSLGDVC